jgi:hypothetical protein
LPWQHVKLLIFPPNFKILLSEGLISAGQHLSIGQYYLTYPGFQIHHRRLTRIPVQHH